MSHAPAVHPTVTLRARGLRPNKALGQNFLLDLRVAQRIAVAATPDPGGTVLEIGAGLGALTRPLLDRATRIIAIERDAGLAAALQDELGARPELVVLHADALELDWLEVLRPGPAPHVLAGNLPYVITGPVLERTVAAAPCIARAVYMVQREVAARIAAPPGSRTYGALSVFVQAAFAVGRLCLVKPGAFYPAPGVESAVVVLEPLRPPRAVESPAFRTVVRSAFAERRKMLRNAWRTLGGWSPAELGAHAAACGIALDARAETLDVEAFARMATRLEGR